MCLTEYDEEQHMAFIRQEGIQEGIQIGHEGGVQEGIQIADNRYSALMNKLLSMDKYQDIRHAVEDKDFREALYKEYGF